MTRNFLKFFGLGLALTASSAFATVISPGQTAPPDLLAVGAGASLVATVSGTIAPGTFTGSYTESVYADPTNVFCAGCYDFVYNITNSGSTGIIERGTGFSFDTTVLTDVGYTPGTGAVPGTVDRSTDGSVVGFNFIATDAILPGQSSDALIIETNSRNYMQGLVSLQDGSAGTGAGLAPATVPEPVSVSLLGGGLFLLGAARWRKAKKA